VNYPWLLLVPRKAGAKRLIDLSLQEQMQLMQELDHIQRRLWETFMPTQLNVAAIGNKVEQLHIHIIARYDNDPAWPGTVWDHPVRSAYSPLEKATMKDRMRQMFSF
jgi:diadenosine tetraphosphate (Ap4A) HIT family hydrolase